MAFVIICAVIGAYIMFSEWEGITDGLCGMFFGALIGCCLWGIVGGIIGLNLQTVETVEEQEIFALNDSSSPERANYLFTGYINENLVYRYVINADRGKHIEELDAESCYIKEGDYKPTVKTYTTHLKEDWYYWFAHDILVSESYVVFFVPENTVTNEYNIDLD